MSYIKYTNSYSNTFYADDNTSVSSGTMLADVVIGIESSGIPYIIKNRFGSKMQLSALDLFRIGYWLMSNNYEQVRLFLATK
jgi:hypothetical protein